MPVIRNGKIVKYDPTWQQLGTIQLMQGDTIDFGFGNAVGYLRDADGNTWNFEQLFQSAVSQWKQNGQEVFTFDTEDDSLVFADGQLMHYKSHQDYPASLSGLVDVDVEFVTQAGKRVTLFKFEVDITQDITRRFSPQGEARGNKYQPRLSYPVLDRHPVRTSDFGVLRDLTSPKVEITPVDGAKGVSISNTFKVRYTEPVRTIDNESPGSDYLERYVFSLFNLDTKENTPIQAGVLDSQNFEVFVPGGMRKGNRYLFRAAPLLEDYGNNRVGDVSVQITTEATGMSVPKLVIAPVNGAVNVGTDTEISVGSTVGVRLVGGVALTSSNLSQAITIRRRSTGAIVPYSVTLFSASDLFPLEIEVSPNELLSNTQYEVEVKGLEDLNGNTIPLQKAIFTTITSSAPGKVGALTVGTPTGGSVPIEWPVTNGATSYRYEWATQASFADVQSGTTQNNSALVSPLQPDTKYYLRVIGINSFGEGTYSDVSEVTTSASANPGGGTDTRAKMTWGAMDLPAPTTQSDVEAMVNQFTSNGQASTQVAPTGQGATITIVDGQTAAIITHSDVTVTSAITSGFDLIAEFTSAVVGQYRITYIDKQQTASTVNWTFNTTDNG